jgi:hypothetical protein
MHDGVNPDFLLKDGCLEISAIVDAEGLQTLKEMLGKYEEILKLMEKSAANKPLPPLPY